MPGAAAGVLACGGMADANKLPPDVQDPATLKTPSGAVARYRGALSLVGGALDRVMTASAIITDELAALSTKRGLTTEYTEADSRSDLSGFDGTYNRLHRLRAEAREARGFLTAYAPDSSPALQGHLYAAEAYAEIWLADLFCSGIPLSTVDFDGNYTLAAGSTTADVYRHATILFDSAVAISGDSERVQQLAAVGKGRALLALGRYAEAAAAVSGVSDAYAYWAPFQYDANFGLATHADSAALWFFLAKYPAIAGIPSLADREGANGLDYRSSGDPRTVAVPVGTDGFGNTMYFPSKYPQSGTVPYLVASGIEARLIEAEASVNLAGSAGEWLAKLNALRTDGTFDTQPNADDPSRTDTLWHAGSGGVPGLGLLADPGDTLSDPTDAKKAREDLLFRERAFWLYLDGHRQGDLRRLLRLYPGRTPDQVYPIGFYPGGTGSYGTEIVAEVPKSERDLNSKYTGCITRGP